mgnify:CR=1 FL=1
MPTAADGLAAVDAWFARQGWSPAPFQRRAWAAFRDGRSGLIHSPTGSGKSLAAWLGPVSRALDRGDRGGGLRVLWITPLRALAEEYPQLSMGSYPFQKDGIFGAHVVIRGSDPGLVEAAMDKLEAAFA